jgi:transmembrane sensor
MAEKNKNIEHIDDLIIKYLSGNSNFQEEETILNWIAENSDNKKYFQQLSDIWNISSVPAYRGKVNSEKAYYKFQNSIEKPERRKILLWVYSSAAAILLLISLFTLQSLKFDNRRFLSDNIIVSDTLPDGSIVSMNKQSSLKYYAKKIKRKRYAILEGEAFFNVKHENGIPFYVLADGVEICVTGTSFNVKTDINDIYISLVEGKLTVNFNDTSKAIFLKSGESVSINRKSKTIEGRQSIDLNDITWKTNELVFKNTSLAEVIKRLEKTYDISFQYDQNLIGSMKFDGRLNTDDLNTILSTLEVTFNINFAPSSEHTYIITAEN